VIGDVFLIDTVEKAMDFIKATNWKGSVLGLERIGELMRLAGDVQKQLRFVHIAGTNGKGSTAAMAANVLATAGYKVGLFTSPFLEDFNELIQINGVKLPNDRLVFLCAQLQACAAQMEDAPTEYEIITALAFLHFFHEKCDIVVLEVGMGGRLDSTNVIDTPEVAVITAIGLDHMEYLGGTVEKIAGEKAGIIKGGLVVCHPQGETVKRVILEKCASVGAEATFAEVPFANTLANFTQSFKYSDERFSIPLLGSHQRQNAAVVIEITKALRRRGWEISDNALQEGLANTRWPGRFELIRTNPPFIIDVAHNPQGIQAALRTLQKVFPNRRFIFIFGVLADKDFKEMAELLLPHAKKIFLVTPENPRALPATELAEYFYSILSAQALPPQNKFVAKCDVFTCEEISQGIALATQAAEENAKKSVNNTAYANVICALGSLSLVGTVRKYVAN